MDDSATDLGGAGFGLMFYNARWYDPALGRFTQADSIIPPGVQGYDRYAYVNNSPVNFTDPSGHIACDDTCQGDGGGGSTTTNPGCGGLGQQSCQGNPAPNKPEKDTPSRLDGNCGLGGIINCPAPIRSK